MSKETCVLYNAECPICRAEIDHYAAYAEKMTLPIRFDDLTTGTLETWGLTQETAAQRLHVMKDGVLHSGIPAFIILWQDMPRYAWLARLVALPGVHRLAVLTYDRILAPLLYRWHLRRQRRVAETSP